MNFFGIELTSSEIIIISAIASLIGYAIWDVFRTKNIYTALQNFINSATSNEDLRQELIAKYNTLPESQQKYVNAILGVLSPFQDVVPTDLDKEVIEWLEGIIRDAKNQDTPNG